ncbi:potassium channel family protein [Streptomyces sp. NPDC051684]|uniref:potassium channel family protein n=1 Tax=Streptomyces sp. NPDC051684 TaxID=3365670 RepID=UPI00378878DE
MTTDHARARWERRTQGPLLLLAVAFSVAYALPIVAPDAAEAVMTTCHITSWGVWGAFAVDYAVRFGLADDRLRFVRANPLALLAVALPMLQPLRLLKLVSLLLLVGQRARMATQVRVTTYVAGCCAGLLVFGALAVLEVERGRPGASIHTLGDSFWWAFTTMTTVGYGDMAPTTGAGRALAIGLMLSGIALLGVVTANIAAWFIANFEKDDAQEQRQTAAIEALTEEVRSLRAQVVSLHAQRPHGAPGGQEVPAQTEASEASARAADAQRNHSG